MKYRIALAVTLVCLLLAPGASARRSKALCGFRCNIEHFDFCIFTGEVNYACWELSGGCVSGGASCTENAF